MDNNELINLDVFHLSYINYTFILNKYNFLTKLVLTNKALEDYENVVIKIKSSTNLFEDYSIVLDKLKKEETTVFTSFDLKFDLKFLKNLTEKDLDTIFFEVTSKEALLLRKDITISVLPIDYFGGLQEYPQLLVSYILPNHPLVYKLKAEAVKILEETDAKISFEGYQANSKERVLQMVSSLYKAIQNQELIYSNLPASFEEQGQRIRLADTILNTKFGNCIDLSLLFAACIEAIGINPIIVLTKGHAFVGFWLVDQRFDSMVTTDRTAITKRIAKGINEIAIIETTNLCKGNNISFTNAIDDAERQLMDNDKFLMSIDVKNSRSNGVLPLPVISEQETSDLNLSDSSINNILDDDYEVFESYDDLELTDLSNLTKQKIWERKLLDLSLRNNLLNVRFTKSMLQLVDLPTNLLEDSLADGKTYTILPDNNQQILRKYNLYREPLHSSEDLYKHAEEEFKYNRLLTYYNNEDLEKILVNLYRSSKLAEEENGKSTLYLGIGLVKWIEPRNKLQPRYAPILLIPVELSRKSVNSKFTLSSREEDTMINITLLEYLKQEYNLNLNGLENLPMDDFGVDVQKVFTIIRNSILNLEGWDVLEQTVLGIFSFNKLILWQDISKYSQEIEKSAIVKSLIDGKLASSLESVAIDTEELEQLPTSTLMLPISTDNSQLNAVKNANLNKTFILHGPPGTGKSQTITNIIADALYNDKKVLFVAAKKAALDVVYNRLEKIGLGPYCLELHSNKSKKSDVLKQFERTLEVPKYQSNENFIEEANLLDEKRKELSKYVMKLHAKNAIDWSIYETISYLDYNKVALTNDLQVAINFNALDKNKWNEWNNWITPFNTIIKKVGVPNKYPLKSLKIHSNQFNDKNNILSLIESYKKDLAIVQPSLDIYSIDSKQVNAYYNALNFIDKKSINERVLESSLDVNLKDNFTEWVKINNRKSEIFEELTQTYNRSIVNFNFQDTYLVWNQSKHTWFLPKWFKQRKVKSTLQGYAKTKINSEALIDKTFLLLEEYKVLLKQGQEEKYSFYNSAFNSYFDNDIFNASKLKEEKEVVDTLNNYLEEAGNSSPINWIKNNFFVNNLSNQLDEILPKIQNLRDSHLRLLEYFYQVPELEELNAVVANIDLLEDWINFNSYQLKAKDLEVTWFIDLINKGLINTDDAYNEFIKVIRLNHFIQTVYSEEVLNNFVASIYESFIKQYKDYHQQFVEITKNQIAIKLSSRIPNVSAEAAKSSEIGLLQKAIRSNGRGITIRKLFDQIPTLLPRLKPCMLMSPISVAQYFDVNENHFDLVIFDEASQLPTSEAISALSRAKQAIIVGDPKQMPPTSFFASNKIDEDNMEMEDLESILEDTLALSIPSNYLLRHYRSKHESLISFSNKNFYDSKLLTFPSPDDLSQKVTFELVNGFYDKGKTRTNKLEAETIIKYIKNHLETKNNKTLGVVTFSQVQQDLIDDLLQKLYVENPSLEEFAMTYEEPIFIKNLENVQGDERDIILFSICYGPDEDGKVSMNFGPLNREGGWRRLNVAVTRARYEMKIFSTLKGEQIDLSRTNSEGVKALKEFLNFADKGNYVLGSISATNNISLVDAIANELEKHQLKVKKYIGTSEYKVDLGIINPENDKEYILGILLDGDNYLQINTTNDRELLVPGVLKGLGWKIHRIWTLDWIKNKTRCVDEVLQIVQDIKNNNYKEVVDNKPQKQNLVIEKPTLLEVESTATAFTSRLIPYQVTELESLSFANTKAMLLPENESRLLNQMHGIVLTEAPISKSLLFKRILKLWKVTRSNDQIINYLNSVINDLPANKTTSIEEDFYWSNKVQPNTINFYRDISVEKRTIQEIAIEELSVAVLDVIEANLGIDRKELIKMVSKNIGFNKTSEAINLSINQSIDYLLTEGKIKEESERLTLSN